MSAETYEVVASGRLSPALLSAMGGFEIVSIEHGLSHLVGPIPDQYRMHQLRELLDDMNIDLVSINQVGPAAGFEPGVGTGEMLFA